jgi:hypothetical protein
MGAFREIPFLPDRECGQHREALLAFADRREMGPGTDDALAHLERCRTCVRELEETAMAIAALRRLGAAAAPVEPAPDAWARLRARVDRPREALWRWRASIAGLALGGALVAMLLAPGALWTSRQVYIQEAGQASGISETRLKEERAESTVLAEQLARQAAASVVAGRAPATGRDPLPPSVSGWAGPDGAGVASPTVLAAPPVDRTK